jgi:hypothetical protein
VNRERVVALVALALLSLPLSSARAGVRVGRPYRPYPVRVYVAPRPLVVAPPPAAPPASPAPAVQAAYPPPALPVLPPQPVPVH